MRATEKATIAAGLAMMLATSCSISMEPADHVPADKQKEKTIVFDKAAKGISVYAKDISMHLSAGDTFAVRVTGYGMDVEGLQVVRDSEKGGGHVSITRCRRCLNGLEAPMDIYVTSPEFRALSFHQSGVKLDNLTPLEAKELKLDCRYRKKSAYATETPGARVLLRDVKCDELEIRCDTKSDVRVEGVEAKRRIRIEATKEATVSMTGQTDTLIVESDSTCRLDMTGLENKN